MLTTIERVKAELAITDNADDAALASHILAAEAALGARYRLPVVPVATSTLSRFVDGSLLHLQDCATVTAVTDLDGNPLTYTVIETDDGRVDAIQLERHIVGRVNVAGTWGYASTPPDVERAVVLTACVYYRRATWSEQNDGTPYRGGGDAIPPEAAAIMDARRVRSI